MPQVQESTTMTINDAAPVGASEEATARAPVAADSMVVDAVTGEAGDDGSDVIIQTRGLTKIYRSLFSREGKTALEDLTIDV